MEDKKQTVVRGGTSLFSVALVTTLVFFILKVTNVLAWSWFGFSLRFGYGRPC